MDQHLYHKKSKFIADVLTALHMQFDEFMYNLVHYSPYEIILYIWINKLYEQDKSIEDAVQLIYKARNILLLNPKNTLCNPQVSPQS